MALLHECLKFEAFISEAYPCILTTSDGLLVLKVSLGADKRRGWKERRPLLLFNPLWWDGALY
jgi:hypothetical protein